MGDRTFAGYSYRREDGDSFYGMEHSAAGPKGDPARIVHVSLRLVEAPGYAEALARFGSDLAGLSGDGIVATKTVGRGLDGTLVVVTESVAGTANVEAIRETARGQALPYAIALRLAKGMVDALAHAHRRGIAHGAVHPRSILVDGQGLVSLDHFAAGRALASVAATTDDPEMLAGFRGYLAPELALAEEPTPRSDIYAAGAVLHTFFGGDVASGAQPGRLKATTSIRRLVVRAMDTDASRRFATAVELGQELERAIELDGCEVATDDEMILYSEDARELGAPLPAPRSASVSHGNATAVSAGDLDDLIAGLDDEDSELPALSESDADDDGDADDDDHDDEPTAIAPQRRRTMSPAVDDVLASLEGPSEIDSLGSGFDGDPESEQLTHTGSQVLDADTRVEAPVSAEDIGDQSQLTQVDDALMPDRDPISELIELGTPLPEGLEDDEPLAPPPRARHVDGHDEDHTPLPPPYIHESGSFTREGHEILIRKGDSSVQQRAEDAIADLDTPLKSERVATDYVHRSRIPGWVWGVGTLLAVGVMFMLVWTRTDVFHPERASRKKAAAQAEHKAKEAELRAKQKKGGEIIIEADQEDAAVWLRLGRTPLTTMPLPAYHPHQIRFELEGYAHIDTAIVADDWDKDQGSISRSLVVATPGSVPPAWPPALPDAAKHGFSPGSGLGSIEISSKPEKAEVWLIVGYTNSVQLRDFEAGARYEFKLTKKGFHPGFTVIEPDDWKLGGADQEALRRTVIQRVSLRPVGPTKPR